MLRTHRRPRAPSRALALAIVVCSTLPVAAAGPELLHVGVTEGSYVGVPTGVEPEAGADPGVSESGEWVVLEAGRLRVVLPLYRADPEAHADPNPQWTRVRVPGVVVRAWSPVTADVGHGKEGPATGVPFTRNGTYGATVAADTDLDGEHETRHTVAPFCDCPIVQNEPWRAMWGHAFRGLPTYGVGPTEVLVP